MDINMHFQQIVFKLQEFWGNHGCAIITPYDIEVGAGTFHPDTTLKSLGPEPLNVAHVQVSRRPSDGRYGQNPNRLQRFHQFQVLLKPSPANIQELYLDSLRMLGVDPLKHDIRFVEDDWESPTLGAAGLGWELWCDGMEITQFTYFQQVGGIECELVSGEIAYGIERIACILQDVENIFAINWNGKEGDQKITLGDLFQQNEEEFSYYNFELADTDMLFRHFADVESQCFKLIEHNYSLPAYDMCIKASHLFNLLNARGVISVLERASYIGRVRAMAKACCQVYLESTQKRRIQG
jgi:glycyl-tRNA synthetase alpha chain